MLSDIRNITATRWLQAFCVKYDLSKSRIAARSQRYLVMECRTPVTIAHTGYRKDDMSDKESSASQSAMKFKDNKFVTVIESLFQGKAQEIKDKFGMIDFAWFDCGGHKEYGEFLKEYLPICSGYVLLHYTYYRGKPNPNFTEIETYILNEEWERIDMIEPHKYRQGSFTMIKRRM